MATITEDYCDFETAKLLKEKGFDVPCLAHWYIGSETQEEFSDHPFNWNEVKSDLDWLSCPTLQMAMKWLRVEHNILLFILPAQENGKLVYLVEVWTWNKEEGIYESTYAPMPRKEPEQAVETSLKYCLEHLI